MKFTIIGKYNQRIGTYRDDSRYTKDEAKRQVQLVVSELSIGGLDCVYEFTPTKRAMAELERCGTIDIVDVSVNRNWVGKEVMA